MFLEEFGSYCSLEDVAVIAFGAIWHPPKCLFYNIKKENEFILHVSGRGGWGQATEVLL